VCRGASSFTGNIFCGENLAFIKEGFDFWIGLIEIVRNGELTLCAPENSGFGLLVERHKLGYRSARLGDDYFFAQCDAL
jgi:hypothetical protein